MSAKALAERLAEVYTVHVKHVTATEARKNWFRLLDEVAGGEVVVIERGGSRLVLRRQDEEREDAARLPAYEGLIRAIGPESADRADRWGWDWPGTADGLGFREDEEGDEP